MSIESNHHNDPQKWRYAVCFPHLTLPLHSVLMFVVLLKISPHKGKGHKNYIAINFLQFCT